MASLKLSLGISDEEYLNNVYKKLLNCNFDGASVMNGPIPGVQTYLKAMQPGIIYSHCTAHRLELSMLNSTKFGNTIISLQQVVRNSEI